MAKIPENLEHAAYEMARPSKQPEYHIWAQMRQRCNNPKSKKYPDYGGRGIRVCDEWNQSSSYPTFIRDMGPRPSLKHSLGRIDNDGMYTPINCRWELPVEQNFNKRSTAQVISGDVFGKLTVLYEIEGKIRNTHPNSLRRYFQVKCECGKEKSIRMDKLRQRNNQSCGDISCNKYAPKED